MSFRTLQQYTALKKQANMLVRNALKESGKARDGCVTKNLAFSNDILKREHDCESDVMQEWQTD